MNIKRFLHVAFFALLAGVVVFGSSVALARGSTTTKKLLGKVLDVANKPLSGVSVVATPATNPASAITATTNTKKKNYSLTFTVGTTYTLTYTKNGYAITPPTPIPPLTVTSSTRSIPDVKMGLISPTSLEVSQVDTNDTLIRWQYAGERTGVFFTVERKRTSVIPAVTGGFSTIPAVPAETSFSRLDSKEYALSYYDDSSKLINGYGLIIGQTYVYRVKAGDNSYSNEATITITRTDDGQWHDFPGATGSGTCADGVMNSDETSPDTGGRCGTPVVTPPPVNDGTGTISGTVKLNNGSSIVGQDVTLFLAKNDMYYSASVDTSGSFSSANIQPGVYSVMITSVSNSVTSTYYPSSTYDAVVVTAGQTTSSMINNFAQTTN